MTRVTDDGELGATAGAAAQPAAASTWYPFEHLSGLFGLKPFERDLVVLCAGFELERRFISSCAGAATEDGARRPTLRRSP